MGSSGFFGRILWPEIVIDHNYNELMRCFRLIVAAIIPLRYFTSYYRCIIRAYWEYWVCVCVREAVAVVCDCDSHNP